MQVVLRELDAFVGATAFEDLAHRWIETADGRDALGFEPDHVGRDWDPKGQADLVAPSFRHRQVAIGECKWTTTQVSKTEVSQGSTSEKAVAEALAESKARDRRLRRQLRGLGRLDRSALKALIAELSDLVDTGDEAVWAPRLARAQAERKRRIRSAKLATMLDGLQAIDIDTADGWTYLGTPNVASVLGSSTQAWPVRVCPFATSMNGSAHCRPREPLRTTVSPASASARAMSFAPSAMAIESAGT